MAGHWTVAKPLVSTPASANAYTVFRLVPTSNVTPVDILITEIGVLGGSWQPLDGSGGTGNNNRVLARLCKSASVSGGNPISVTPQRLRDQPDEIFHLEVNRYSAEPTYTGQVVLKQWYFNAASGFVVQFPLGREPRRALTWANPPPGLELMITSVNSFASGQGGVAYMDWVEGSS